MQVACELRHRPIGVDERVREGGRVGGGEADAVYAFQFRGVMDELGQLGMVAIDGAPVGVHVLPQEVDLPHAPLGQADDFGHHIRHRPAHFLPARVGHHAEGAVAAAPFHDGDERGRAVHARRRQGIELLDFREAHVDGRAAVAPRLVQQRRQAMQRLRPEDDIDLRRPLDDGLPFLARHAAADADEHVFPLRLDGLPAPQLVEHLLLRLVADGAGVEQQHIRLLRRFHHGRPATLAQQIRHARRVVHVHLAAVGFDVELKAVHFLSGVPAQT